MTERRYKNAVIHNLADVPCEVRLRIDVPSGERLHGLDERRYNADDGGVHMLVLEACGYRWFRVSDLNHALSRRRL